MNDNRRELQRLWAIHTLLGIIFFYKQSTSKRMMIFSLFTTSLITKMIVLSIVLSLKNLF